MKIGVRFRNIDLGQLSYDGNYHFEANDEGEKQFASLYPMQYNFYLLKGGDKDFQTLPSFFEDFIQGANRKDVIVDCQIEKLQNTFEKLYSIAGLEISSDYQIYQI